MMSKIPIYLDYLVRVLGIHLIAARGTGKSRILGRIFLPQDALAGIPTIVIDPIGETINNFLSKIAELPRHLQEQIWPRVVYVDMAGRNGYVTPFPLYYRLGTESYYQMSQRFIEIVKWADPRLENAPVRGFAPAWWIGTYAGTILAASGFQISELEHLLTHTNVWENHFQKLEKTVPEVAESIAFMRGYWEGGKERRSTQTEALRIKAAVFTIDPETKAMSGAPQPAIDIAHVIEQKQIVLIDVGGVVDMERRRFMLMCLVSYITSFIKARGAGHEKLPLSLVVDEFSLLTGSQSEAHTTFSEELDRLVNVYSRSHRLWLTLASQSIGQFNEGTKRALFSLGTQIFGAVPDMESAKHIAESFAKLNPMKIKHSSSPVVYSSLTEQIHDIAQQLRTLPKFSFLVRPALEEGTVADTLSQVSIAGIDKDMWANPERVEQVKSILRKRSGVPVGPLLAEIASRIPSIAQSPVRDIAKPHPHKRPSLPSKDADIEDY